MQPLVLSDGYVEYSLFTTSHGGAELKDNHAFGVLGIMGMSCYGTNKKTVATLSSEKHISRDTCSAHRTKDLSDFTVHLLVGQHPVQPTRKWHNCILEDSYQGKRDLFQSCSGKPSYC